MVRRNLGIRITRGRHLMTKHAPGERLNDVNPGVYWHVGCFAWGYYRNSHSTKEKILISRWFCLAYTHRDVTYSGGLVSGYPDSWVLPMMMTSETMKAGQKRFRLFFIPQTVLNSASLHAAIESDVSFGTLFQHWKCVVIKAVKNLVTRKIVVPPRLDDPTEFHDSCVADHVEIELIRNQGQ